MSHPHCYVDIAFPLPLPPLTYTNNLADSSLQVGSFARARLRNKSTLGIVTSIHSSYQGDTRRLKPIESIEPISPLPSSTLDLAYWIASYYGCSWGESLFSCFPTYPENRNSILFKPFKISNDRDLVEQWVDSHQRSKKACSILNTLLSDSIFYLGDLKKEYGSYIQPYLKQWQEQQIIVPYSYTSLVCPSISLSEKQQSVSECISSQINQFYIHLLHGVTGSGKTEIYCSIINSILSNNQNVLLMCPEISLAENMFDRLSSRYPHHTLLLHSQMEKSKRFLYHNIASTSSPLLIIGSRLSVLAPINRLGLIIVDEEHDPSYKQEENPRYHARDTAIMRAKMNRFPIILGSATPSIETFFNSKNKKYIYHHLSERFGQIPLPKVLCVDMRFEKKITFFLSILLHQKIKTHLNNKNQIILFINKKGSASMILCESCGQPEKCHFCDVTLTWYAKSHILKCHYCGRQIKKTDSCRSCQSSTLKPIGIGTESVLETIQKSFPDARILQVDTENIQKNDNFSQKILNKDVDIIIGTQMIAKGWNFPDVKLVAVILAESNCLTADFRAAEKSFQLTCQVAGRAGRYQEQGEVIIQTYQPDSFYFKAAIQHNYSSFFEEEIKIRQQYSYPPFFRMIQIIIRDASQKKCAHTAQQLFKKIQNYLPQKKTTLLGPSPMPIAYINSIHRHHILIRLPKSFNFYPLIEQMKIWRKSHHSSVLINTDPYSLF